MNLEKVASLVKLARKTQSESQRDSRMRYKLGGAQVRRVRKRKQRMRRRQGGLGLKNRVQIQTQRLKYKATRIRKEPLQKRPRDKS